MKLNDSSFPRELEIIRGNKLEMQYLNAMQLNISDSSFNTIIQYIQSSKKMHNI